MNHVNKSEVHFFGQNIIFIQLEKEQYYDLKRNYYERVLFLVKFYRRFCDDAKKNRIVVFSYIYDSQREITQFILRHTEISRTGTACASCRKMTTGPKKLIKD